jgi:glutaredoxin
MILVELYSKDDCPLCDEALTVLEKVRQEMAFSLKVIKLLPGEENFEAFKEDFPVIHINKRFAFKHRVHENMLKIRLQQVASEGSPPTLDDDHDFGIEK